VPLHLALTLGDLGERPNAARCNVVDPGTCLGYGMENSVPGLLFEGRLGPGLMQNSFDGSECSRTPRQADDGGAGCDVGRRGGTPGAGGALILRRAM
jgi:hypothetical protein